MHECGLVHCDLHTDNCLVSMDGQGRQMHLVAADFGSCVKQGAGLLRCTPTHPAAGALLTCAWLKVCRCSRLCAYLLTCTTNVLSMAPHVCIHWVTACVSTAAENDTGCKGIHSAFACMAPEVLHPESAYAQGGATAAIDIWAAGCFLYNLMAGSPLFSSVLEPGGVSEAQQEHPLTQLLGRQQAVWVRCRSIWMEGL